MKKFILPLLATLVLSACQEEKLLEPARDNQQYLDYVLRTPAFAEGFLMSAYKDLPGDYENSECATDDAVHNANGNELRRMATGEWSALYSPVSVWNSSYAAIFNINYLLSIVNDVEWSSQDPARNALFIKKNSGEAYALRGYFYLQLLTRHGGKAANGELLGVPLLTTPVKVTDNYKLPRASFREVMDLVYADFDRAMELLPATWNDNYQDDNYIRVFGSQNRGRIQGKIVAALKAKAALLDASPAFNNGNYDTQKAATAAALSGAIIKDLGGAAALPADGILFYDNDNDVSNPEIIWRLNPANNNTREKNNYPPSLFGNGRVNPTQNLVDAFPMKNGYPITHPSSGFSESNPYANRDPRLANFIVTNGSIVRAGTAAINTSANSPTNDGLNKTEFSTRTGFYVKKLLRTTVNLDPTVNSSNTHFYTLLRYTDLYLACAEAANEAWGPKNDPQGLGFTAYDIIAQIRKRAGITQPDNYLATIATKEAMRELIRNERRLELSFEDHRFWDIRRWQLDGAITGTVKGVSINGNTFNIIDVEPRAYRLPDAYYGPIPRAEINKNNFLVQNAGW
ncbi:MAG TPA: RagB/SusD family nutrient uptake outer membrane protein [Niabella sp.]|nr:RagB/SusD family nutrient uptake outer membrane protein [Niabella sp.]